MQPHTKASKLNFAALKKHIPFRDARLELQRRIADDSALFVFGSFILMAVLLVPLMLLSAVAVNLAKFIQEKAALSLDATGLVAFALLMVFMWGVVAAAVYIISRRISGDLRVQKFAKDNGFQFHLQARADFRGVFAETASGSAKDVRPVVSGEYKGKSFAVGNVKHITAFSLLYVPVIIPRRFGVIAMSLPRRIPHVLLDSNANNFIKYFSNLPLGIKAKQKLELEGDFNKYFTLYAPKKYERDVLYFLTPEIMALLIDLGNKYDIEIVDDRLYIFSKQFYFNEKTLQEIFLLIDALGGEFHENVLRYADERVGDKQANIVAKPGRRLLPTASILFAITFISYAIYLLVIVLRPFFEP